MITLTAAQDGYTYNTDGTHTTLHIKTAGGAVFIAEKENSDGFNIDVYPAFSAPHVTNAFDDFLRVHYGAYETIQISTARTLGLKLLRQCEQVAAAV